VVTKNLAVEACGVVSWFVRKVRTASGAAAVQVVTPRGRQVEHVGSAHSDAELALLLTSARERLSPRAGRPGPGRSAALRNDGDRQRPAADRPVRRTGRVVGPSIRWTTFRLMALLIGVTAAASAVLDNVITVLLVAPVVLQVCRQLGLPSVPYLISVACASNIGGTATLADSDRNPDVVAPGRSDKGLSRVTHQVPDPRSGEPGKSQSWPLT